MAIFVRRVLDGVRPCEPPAGSHAVPASSWSGRPSCGLLGRRPVSDAIRASSRPPRCPSASPAFEVPLGRPDRPRWTWLPGGRRWLRAAPRRTRRRGGPPPTAPALRRSSDGPPRLLRGSPEGTGPNAKNRAEASPQTTRLRRPGSASPRPHGAQAPRPGTNLGLRGPVGPLRRVIVALDYGFRGPAGCGLRKAKIALRLRLKRRCRAWRLRLALRHRPQGGRTTPRSRAWYSLGLVLERLADA